MGIDSNDTPIPRTTGFVTSDEDSIYYEASGWSRNVPLMFCHGLGGNHASWFQQVPEFARDYFVITWDHRGFGLSSDRNSSSGPAHAVTDLTAVLDNLDVERVHLVGQSMGGWTALGFVIREPDRVLTLTLADTIAGVYTPEIAAALQGTLQQDGMPSSDWENVLGQHPALGRGFRQTNPVGAYLYQQIAGFGPARHAEIMVGLGKTAYRDNSLRDVQTPVLFLVGEQDELFPPAMVRSVAPKFSNAQVVELPGAGHSPYFETPRAWNDALRQFLGKPASAGA
jgi:3-oxoadipate enol-lactonase